MSEKNVLTVPAGHSYQFHFSGENQPSSRTIDGPFTIEEGKEFSVILSNHHHSAETVESVRINPHSFECQIILSNKEEICVTPTRH